MPDNGPAIRVDDLWISFGDNEVLRGIELEVPRGEVYTVLGGSGCGKTTLLRCLLGLTPPTRGQVWVEGREIWALEPGELQVLRERMGMLFQASALFNSLTVAQNVGLPLREHTDLLPDVIHTIVQLKLEMVGLSGTEELMPAELSGGMRKRAALARALSLDPAIVFFDEPTTGLDPVTAAELDVLIRSLNESTGTTFLLVTHDLDTALTVSHRVLMLDDGEVRAAGTPEAIRNTDDDWVQRFIGRWKRRGSGDEGDPPGAEGPEDGFDTFVERFIPERAPGSKA